MTQEKRIQAFARLGNALQNPDEQLTQLIAQAHHKNAWYTPANVQQALSALSANLNVQKLSDWLAPYTFGETHKTVGLILAGNIPLVGFHDLLCTLIAGFSVQIKVSSEDAGLTTYVINKLIEIEPDFKTKIAVVNQLADFDLVIATGSNNSARYFEYYFGKYPHIIRKNRNSVAILNGHESAEDLTALGHDIFDYFGLGCRSVSKIFIPENYDIKHFFEGIAAFEDIIHHFKYTNNYDFNKSIYLINKEKHWDNGFLLVKEDPKTASPLSVVFYETYTNVRDLQQKLLEEQENLQCIVSNEKLTDNLPVFSFGQSQQPDLEDYADGVNTLDFLFANQ